ncbi:MAG TPA: MCE family protein [Bacteroidetes bacterium]|nr:MCE family protein [Bacteroidota bacterium]
MRKETKIGLFTVITVFLAIWGYKYLRGFNIFDSNTTLYAVYEKVNGVRISTPIYINGLQVGLVADFAQIEDDLNKIKVVMNINDGIKVPKDAVAEIVPSFMGGVEIHLTFKGTCSNGDCAQSGDFIKGRMKSMLGGITSPEEMSLYTKELSKGLTAVIDTLNQRLGQSDEINKSVSDARAILVNLKSTTGRLDRLMAGSSSAIEGSMKNVESITANLKDNNKTISAILASAEKLSSDLEKVKISELSGDVQQTMKQLQATLASSDKAINDLGILLKSLNEGGEGAVAMLLHDKKFADNLQLSIKNLDLLLQDFRLHPERYRRILSKKKMPYEAPAVDPGH